MSDITTVLTIDEVLDYLGIDYADDKVNRNITRAISTADKIIQGSVGVNYPVEDARSKELALIIVSDLYDIRGTTCRDNVSNNVRRLVEDMSLQLKLELGSDPIIPPVNPDIPDVTIVVDTFFDLDSENPIANKVVAIEIENLWDNLGSLGGDIGLLTRDVAGIQQQINLHAHFKGYFATNTKILATEATPNDFAYSAESGTKWVYDEAEGWQDTGVAVPDQLTPASDSTPLVNGEASVGTENAYARGDHRHPTDETRASQAELDEAWEEINNAMTMATSAVGDIRMVWAEINPLKTKVSALESNIGNIDTALENIIAIQNSLIGGGAE